jgi:DNA repair protein RecN (Recombination protein N)
MLTELDIRAIVLIDHLTLTGLGGLTALTGETGAGKSIVLDALGLLRGDRADPGLIRQGADQATISAVLEVPANHPIWADMTERGLDTTGALHLRRVITRDGKSRAYVNDQSVTLQTLRHLGTSLIDLHGQWDTQALFNPATHRDLVDAWGSLGDGVARVRAAWDDWQQANAELSALTTRVASAQAQQDYTQSLLDELDALDPQADEEENLLAQKKQLSHWGQVTTALNQVVENLDGDHGAAPALAGSLRLIDRLGDKAPPEAAAWSGDLGAALDTARDLSARIQQKLADWASVDQSPEQIDDRLYALRALARKLNVPVSQLPTMRARLAQELADLAAAQGDLTALHAKAQAAQAHYDRAAKTLRTKRQAAAKKLDRAVMDELPPLKLGTAQFVTHMLEADPGPHGVDTLQFMVATNPGMPLAPLHKTASGGELSRLMLALKLALADLPGGPITMIFDEIDAGLGGAVATAVAERLARLARTTQVLTVTHAPQVAAHADHHWRVRKSTKGGITTTVVDVLDDAARREEIARMLAGATITPEARAAADRLIEQKVA